MYRFIMLFLIFLAGCVSVPNSPEPLVTVIATSEMSTEVRIFDAHTGHQVERIRANEVGATAFRVPAGTVSLIITSEGRNPRSVEVQSVPSGSRVYLTITRTLLARARVNR